MAEPPTQKARVECGRWLATCIQLGWPKGSLDDLESLWWTHHDAHGRLVTTPPVEKGAD